MVDLTRDEHGQRASEAAGPGPGPLRGDLQDLAARARRGVPGSNVEIATLDPFHGYKNAIDDQLEDARSVLDAFHVVKLATAGRRRRPPPGAAGHHRPPRPPGRPAVPGPEHPARRARSTSPTGSAPASTRRSPPGRSTSRSSSPGSAPSRSAPPTTRTATPPAAPSRRRSSPPCTPARSRRWPASARPCGDGAASSSATSTPTARPTAAPKPSTGSSSSTAASPAAYATARTTASGCSSSPADYQASPTLIREEPANVVSGLNGTAATIFAATSPTSLSESSLVRNNGCDHPRSSRAATDLSE